MLMKKINSMIYFPTPSNISYWWNFGSLLGICLLSQIISGLFLVMYYSPNIYQAFNSIIYMIRETNNGWMIRTFHSNMASLFFLFLYLHISRNLFFNSFYLKNTWFSGITIFLISMMIAFLGYVLPWGQMSFWGAMVITNLLSAIPYIGIMLTEWIWGNFSINNATLTRFFCFHFILPLILTLFIMIHLFFLHNTGSNNPLGINSNQDKIIFHPFFTWKDFIGFIMLFLFISITMFKWPYMLSDPENFSQANPLITPIHIQPEWYFLFAYTILRSIPNKLSGVIALFMSILILYFIPFINNSNFKSNKFSPFNFILLWLFFLNFIILTWLGSKPIEYPYLNISQLSATFYFLFFFINPLLKNLFYKIL
uniref:Cytochrome b n=1 Tax=Mengenilla moldrzyki TaxID=1155016 RepID=J3S1W6_MENMO|nr:cytochrome b [Mengenilla moldrzyki]AFC35470.1 cytochrome b [Mengenilla moldrzyki]